MNNIIDLNREREINTLINKLGKLINVDPQLNERTFDYLNGDNEMPDTDKTKTVSVRFPIELLEWIDGYSRISAVNMKSRITRNATVVGFLETMRAIIQHQEKTQWGKSHQDMIKELLESGQNREETQQHEVTP